MIDTVSLSAKDCLYIVDRYVDSIPEETHRATDFRLVLVSGCGGVTRKSGDSLETLSDLDLTLAAPGLEIIYTRDYPYAPAVRVVSVRFPQTLFSHALLAKNLFHSIGRMLSAASTGIVFTRECAMNVFGRIVSLRHIESEFDRLIEFISILHTISAPGSYRNFSVASGTVSAASVHIDPRITAVQEYIAANFNSDIRLTDLAAMTGFTPTAFSRFYKLKSGMNVSDFINEVRINHASTLLTGTDIPISDLCFQCGFNNISNFNRIFRKKRGCTPSEYREKFRKVSMLC